MICDRLGRLFGRLGLERKARDVGPTLASVAAEIKRGRAVGNER
jgi:hypothetical protein